MATVWDGVYTPDQAAKGRDVYATACASCHGASLEGADVAPPLAGSLFNNNWSGTTLGDLAVRIRTTMPLDKPGTLNRQQVADLTAYLLEAGRFPAGDAPLDVDPVVMGQIRFEALRPEPR